MQLSYWTTLSPVTITYNGGGGGRSTKKIFAQGKIKGKKNSCTKINPKRYSCHGLKTIHTRNLITKKNSCGSKIPHPSNNFSNGPPLNEPMNLSWTRIHHRHPKLTLWVRYANLTFFQESRCRVLSDRWDFVWEIKYWGLRRPNISVFTFCYKINKGDLTLMSFCVFFGVNSSM